MTIWILALVFIGLLGVAGFFQGAVRTLVILGGLIVSALLAVPLGTMLRPIFPLIGVKNEVWVWIWPPFAAFLLLVLVIGIIAYVVHRQVDLHFKYKTDDVQYLRWQRLNQRLGLCFGLVSGIAVLLIVASAIYVVGYATTQVITSEEAPLMMRLLNTARGDLSETGLDKTIARIAPASPRYYQAMDIVGLIYHNPLLHNRLSTYPAFFTIAERPEVLDITSDAEYREMLQRRDPIQQIIEHPKTQILLKNSDIRAEVGQIDLVDLNEYLTTGASPKYASEKILGRWQLHVSASLSEIKKLSPNLSGSDWQNIRKAVSLFLSGMTMTFTPDNRVFMKAKSTEEIQKMLESQAAQAAATAATAATSDTGSRAQTPGTGFSPRSLTARINPPAQPQDDVMMRRYGRTASGAVPAAPVAAPAPQPLTNPLPKLSLSGEGTWKREGDKYIITVQQDGREVNVSALVRGDFLVLEQAGMAMVFEKL